MLRFSGFIFLFVFTACSVSKTPQKSSPGETVILEKMPPNEKFLFSNWTEAKANFKWADLETPKEDPNVYRFFENGSLTVIQKTSYYAWTHVKITDDPLPSFWNYTASFKSLKGHGIEPDYGILLNGEEDGSEVKYLFEINPVNQTYWFGKGIASEKRWLTLNKVYNGILTPLSSAIHKNNPENEETQNTVAIQRRGNVIDLKINGILVETVAVQTATGAFNSLKGIGILGKGKQAFSVNDISFSFMHN